MTAPKYVGVLLEETVKNDQLIMSVLSKFIKADNVIVAPQIHVKLLSGMANSIMSPDMFGEFAKNYISYCVVFASSIMSFSDLVDRELGEHKDKMTIIAVIQQ
jgi:hypothetical protein